MPRTLTIVGALLSLWALNEATPLVPRNLCKTFVDTFDNITVLPAAPETGAFTFYGGLQYSDMDAAATQLAGVGLVPPSSPNGASMTINQDLTKSGVVTVHPFGSISTNATSVKYFSLTEFYYGCFALANGVPVVVACTLEVYGYYKSGTQVPSVTYSFSAPNQVSVPMHRALLPPLLYTDLQTVSFGVVVGDPTLASLTALIIDNVTHTNCY